MNKCLSPQGTVWSTSLFLLERLNVIDSVKNINFEAHADLWTSITQHYLLPSSNTTFNEGIISKKQNNSFKWNRNLKISNNTQPYL